MGYSDVIPSIWFLEDGVFPKVSTCALTLSVPINFPTDRDQFKERMDLAILGSQGFFGQV